MQSYQEYDIVECCYDNSNLSLIEMLKNKNIFKEKKYFFLNKKFKNNFECENYLFNYIFNDLKYDVCINTNVDDIYSYNRFEKEINEIKKGNDIVSSNYKIFQDYKNEKYERKIDIVNNKELISTEYKNRLFFTKMILDKKVKLSFSCTTFNKKCWENSNKNIQYPETLYLLKSIVNNKIKVGFIMDYLMEHRIHNEQYSNIYKDNVI